MRTLALVALYDEDVMVEDQIYMLRKNLIAKRDVLTPFHAQSILKIISDDEDVMEDQIYVLPE